MTEAMKERLTRSLTSEDYNARFREIIDAEFPGLEGRQEPERLVCDRGGDRTHGEKALKLAQAFGIRPMPWQREQVLLALSVDEDGHWLHPDVVLICPRQNGKSLILEIIVLYRMFKLNHQIVFTAHQWKTAKSIRNRLWKRIKSRPWAARRLVRNTASAGEAEMEVESGGKVQFSTRSNDFGRGFDEIDLLILDEAYNLDSGELDAVAPIQLAAADPQTYYTSSAVNEVKHAKGEELSKVRASALAGETEGMLFAEFMAPIDMDPEDPETWKWANPSYGVVATEKKIRSLKNKLTDVGFEVEMLGWGRWFVVAGDDAESTIISLSEWAAKAVASTPAGDSCLGIDTTPGGERVGMVAAIANGDVAHLSVAPVDELDRVQVVASVSRTVELNDPVAVVLDPSGPGSTLVEPLEAADVAPELTNGSQVSQAYELFLRLWHEGRITHDGDPRWGQELSAAQERSKNGRYRALDRYASEVPVLVAATLAVWGLQEFRIPDDVHVEKKTKFVGRARPVQGGRRVVEMAF